MKKLLLPFAVLATNSLLMARGDIAPVEPVVNIPAVVEEANKSNFYLGLGVAAVSARDADVSPSLFDVKNGQDRLGNIDLLAGYEFHRHFAVEARYTTSFTKRHFTEMEGWSIFAKPKYPITWDFTLYGLLGYGNVQLDKTVNYGFQMDESGLQWGLGLSYMFNEYFDFFADYKFLANEFDGFYNNLRKELSVDSFTEGVICKF